MEGVLPVDIRIPNLKVQTFDASDNEEKLCYHLDLQSKIREIVIIRNDDYHQWIASHFN